MDSIAVGIIGAGRIGRIHAENLHHLVPGAHLAAVADVFPDKVLPWARTLGLERVSREPREVIEDAGIQAVVVCTSTDTHADLVVAAAERGKHVFCEKPIDLTLGKARRAVQRAERAGVKLQVGFNRRFDHNFRRIRDLVSSGAVGTPHVVRITSRDPGPPPVEYVRSSGGIFLDMMIHDFDMARFLTGSEVVDVFARGAVLVDPAIGQAGDVDTAIVTLTFASGALGVIDGSRGATYGYDQRVEVFGSKGAASCENDTASSVRLSDASGVTGEKPLHFFLERYQRAFLDEMRAFVAALREDRPVPVTGEDGLRPIAIALAAGRSLEERRPVRVADVEG
jgi:myo-inositol 2-dehydrogenase/D-chiro-inositol 1-dehydrogenase